ncbi:hypothetical protein CYMTET_53215, partial [Cymbomonas tetramitiformis]
TSPSTSSTSFPAFSSSSPTFASISTFSSSFPTFASPPSPSPPPSPPEVVRERVRRFLAGDWEELYRVSVPSAPAWPGRASEERAFADVVSLVKEGQLSKAVRRLDPGALAPLVEETLEALRDLHPAGDGLPGRVQAAPLELEEAAVEAECRRLPVASGPGCSQLRFEHIGVIFGGGDGLPAIKHACEQFVGDRVPAGVLPWIMGARLVALLKPGGGVRPIACGESLRRLAGKVVCRQMRTRWATYFSPPPREGPASSAAQLGVGVPGGAEVCVHTVQALLGADPSWCDLALDCKNAFNTVKRSVIHKEVNDNFPELLGMAESNFRHRARLGWQGADGRFRWVESAEGAQQGDPLGPFFTAVALQPALQATLDEHPDVFIMAYLDGIHIIGPPDKARAAYGTIVPLLRAAGLELNVSKSTVYSPAGACPEFADVVDGGGAPMPGSVTPLDGVKVLGIPVGSDRWVADKCVEMAFAAGAVLPKLARLDDPQVQLLLLRFCAHPRFMHLVRGVPPHLLVRGALAHDNGIQECLQEVAGSPYPLGEEAVALSQLPTRWGGLGLSSAQRLAPAGWLGSWAQVWGRMVVLFPAPLTRLTKSSVEWEWGPKEQAAQDAIKEKLTSAPTLALPNMRAAAEGEAPFVVQTDASGVALGGVLMQDLGQGLRPIAYEGRQFSPAEQNYGTGERELCALHHCCTVAWRHYLVFTNFKLQGDHRPLEWLMSPGRELSRRQARWYMDLVEVGVPKMEWIPGRMLQVPDALSRRPDYHSTCPREGLRESGVMSRETDLPVGGPPPNVSLEEGARLSCLVLGGREDPAGGGWQDLGLLWMDALCTLGLAEEAMEEHLAPMTTRTRKSRESRESEGPPYPPEPPSTKEVPSSLEEDVGPQDSKDREDRRVCQVYFEDFQKQFGDFDVDACCGVGGHNRRVDRYWTDCLRESWQGLHVWCSPPPSNKHTTIESILKKFVEEWRLDPEHTSAVFLLPDLQSCMPRWRRLFRQTGMRIVQVIPTHDHLGKPTQLFESSDGTRILHS